MLACSSSNLLLKPTQNPIMSSDQLLLLKKDTELKKISDILAPFTDSKAEPLTARLQATLEGMKQHILCLETKQSLFQTALQHVSQTDSALSDLRQQKLAAALGDHEALLQEIDRLNSVLTKHSLFTELTNTKWLQDIQNSKIEQS